MICPRCAASLTGKQRSGRICAHCGKRFALDPAVHGTGMHDIRIRGIAERATDHGRLKITLTQLWYLSRSRNYAWAGRDPEGVAGEDPLAHGAAGGRRPRRVRRPDRRTARVPRRLPPRAPPSSSRRPCGTTLASCPMGRSFLPNGPSVP